MTFIITECIKKHLKFEFNGDKYNNAKTQMATNSSEGSKYFNGHYWYLLPIWNKLHYFHTILLCIVWSPMIFGGTYIGVTRIRDYWHSDVDCVTGAIIGMAVAYYFGYKRYFHEIYGVYTNNNDKNNSVNVCSAAQPISKMKNVKVNTDDNDSIDGETKDQRDKIIDKTNENERESVELA